MFANKNKYILDKNRKSIRFSIQKHSIEDQYTKWSDMEFTLYNVWPQNVVNY